MTPGPPEPVSADEPRPVTSRTKRLAVGYLREDLSTDLGYDAFRLRLTAMAQGYTLRRVLLADSPDDTLHLLTIFLDGDASALVILELDHLSGFARIALRTVCDIISSTTVLPRLGSSATDSP